MSCQIRFFVRQSCAAPPTSPLSELYACSYMSHSILGYTQTFAEGIRISIVMKGRTEEGFSQDIFGDFRLSSLSNPFELALKETLCNFEDSFSLAVMSLEHVSSSLCNGNHEHHRASSMGRASHCPKEGLTRRQKQTRLCLSNVCFPEGSKMIKVYLLSEGTDTSYQCNINWNLNDLTIVQKGDLDLFIKLKESGDRTNPTTSSGAYPLMPTWCLQWWNNRQLYHPSSIAARNPRSLLIKPFWFLGESFQRFAAEGKIGCRRISVINLECSTPTIGHLRLLFNRFE